jgi:CBS domain-containing protein
MNGEQIMKRNPKCLSDKDTVLSAARLMRDGNIGFIPICGDGGKVVGTVTDRDIVVRVAADGGALTTPLGQFMSRDVVFCRPQDDLQRIERMMADKRKSRVVCIDDGGRAVGVVSLSDIAQHEDRGRAGDLLRTITMRESTTPQH